VRLSGLCQHIAGDYRYFGFLSGRPAFVMPTMECDLVLWYATQNEAWIVTPAWAVDEFQYCRAFALSRSNVFDPTQTTEWHLVEQSDGKTILDEYMEIIPLSGPTSSLTQEPNLSVPPSLIEIDGHDGRSQEINGIYQLVDNERIVPISTDTPVQYPTYEKVDGKNPVVLWFNHFDRYWCFTKKEDIRPFLYGDCEAIAVSQTIRYDPCAIESCWYVHLGNNQGWDMDPHIYIQPVQRNLTLPIKTFYSPNYKPNEEDFVEVEETRSEFCLDQIIALWTKDLPKTTLAPSLCIMEEGKVLVDCRSNKI